MALLGDLSPSSLQAQFTADTQIHSFFLTIKLLFSFNPVCELLHQHVSMKALVENESWHPREKNPTCGILEG